MPMLVKGMENLHKANSKTFQVFRVDSAKQVIAMLDCADKLCSEGSLPRPEAQMLVSTNRFTDRLRTVMKQPDPAVRKHGLDTISADLRAWGWQAGHVLTQELSLPAPRDDYAAIRKEFSDLADFIDGHFQEIDKHFKDHRPKPADRSTLGRDESKQR